MRKVIYNKPKCEFRKMQMLQLITFTDTQGGGAPGYGGGTEEGGISAGNVKEEKEDNWTDTLW